MGFRIRTKVTDRDVGYKKMVESLQGLGQLTLGVMGEKAEAKHPNSELMVGEVAAIHELGLGVPKRSWLAAWIDAHQREMIADAAAAYQDVIAGRLSRKKAFESLGLKWTTAIRHFLVSGQVTPPIKPITAKLKGHNIPLIDTYAIHNAITYKVFLPRWKNVPRGVLTGGREMPDPSTAVPNSPQAPDKGGSRMFGPKAPRGLRPKFGPRRPRAPKFGPRQERYGVKRSKKYGGMNSSQYAAARRRKVKASKLRRVAPARARAVRASFRTTQRASWAWKLIKKLLRKAMSGAGDGRNHGFSGSKRFGQTGFRGR